MAESFETHPSAKQIEALAKGTLDRTDRRRVIHHIMAGCRECHAAAARAWPFDLGGDPPRGGAAQETFDDSLDETLSRVLERVQRRRGRVEAERREAPHLWREIEALRPEQRRLLVVNGRKFHSSAFSYLLNERAEAAGFEDATVAVELAGLAIVVAERLDRETVGVQAVRDLLGHSWATLGNARRIAGDLDGAEEALAIAGEWLSQGSGDPLEEARHLDFVADIRRAQRRFQESLELRSQLLRLYRRAGDEHLEGRTLVAQAKTLDDMQDHSAAAATLERALPFLDAEREPRVLLAAYHNLIHALNDLGRADEAATLLGRARPLYDRVGGSLNLLRLRWLEGKIERQRGRHLAACRALLEVRDAFLSRNMGYEAALITLDLALTHLEAGNHAEVRRLAIEAIPVFESLGIRREVLAALLALREAAQRDLLSATLLEELYARANRNSANAASSC
ncbi:MAG TPA: tetratricopeptide repeat protein [Thermoanaerobaculia bacterium]|nr:tetratricopeptide repeat protein [Thermoanaerobaculia bacterium]